MVGALTSFLGLVAVNFSIGNDEFFFFSTSCTDVGTADNDLVFCARVNFDFFGILLILMSRGKDANFEFLINFGSGGLWFVNLFLASASSENWSLTSLVATISAVSINGSAEFLAFAFVFRFFFLPRDTVRCLGLATVFIRLNCVICFRGILDFNNLGE